jgi:hypothetical protein
MKKSFFTTTRSVTIEEIKNTLEEEMPQYEYITYGLIGKGLKVKVTGLIGVRVSTYGNRIFVSKRPPTVVGMMLDGLTFGFISDVKNRKLRMAIVDCLKKKYGQMDSL